MPSTAGHAKTTSAEDGPEARPRYACYEGLRVHAKALLYMESKIRGGTHHAQQPPQCFAPGGALHGKSPLQSFEL